MWQADPGASLAGELRTVAAKVRVLVGPDTRPTVCFDRGGWSPKLFADLDAAFATHTIVDAHGRPRPHPACAPTSPPPAPPTPAPTSPSSTLSNSAEPLHQ